MSNHFYSQFFGLFGTFMVVAGVLSSRYPRLRRPVLSACGLLWIGFAVALELFFPKVPGGEMSGWIFALVGVLFLFLAGPGWRNFGPLEQDDADLVPKPAKDRPLRKFGEAP